MRATVRDPRRPRGWTPLTLLLAAVLAAACGADVPPTPGASVAPQTAPPSAASSAAPATASPFPSATPGGGTPSPTRSQAPVVTPADQALLTRGALAVTVTDDLRVRSEPRVANDSVKHTPTLPAGTQLIVIGGPVEASGYTWIQVSPVGFKLRGDVDAGWVAIADNDGTPWVGPAKDPTPGYELASVTVARSDPDLDDARAAATAQNAFGIALYRRMLRDPSLDLAGKGVVISPYSITTALAMARAGARGETAAEMDAVLNVPGWDQLGPGLSALDQRLASRDAAWVGYEADRHWLSLRTANMAFAQLGYPFERAYLDRLAATFGAGVGSVDYLERTAEAREAINGWVSRQTLGRIPELLSQEDVTGDTRLVLVNAVYLKAEWVRQFSQENTRNRAFTTAAGDVIEVPTMTQYGEQAIPLATGDGWKATELMYAGPDGDRAPLSMTLILPDDMATFERRLSPTLLATIGARLSAETRLQRKVTYPSGLPEDCGEYAYQVQLRLPRFGTDTRAKLPEPLMALGMVRAFDPFLADLSGMTTTDDPLFIKTVIHQANIDVDEVGTTAAAATAVGVDTGGCTGPSPRTTHLLSLNRPFMYLIRDRETGAILFLGRVLDPTAR